MRLAGWAGLDGIGAYGAECVYLHHLGLDYQEELGQVDSLLR
jgi:hypothetical protein